MDVANTTMNRDSTAGRTRLKLLIVTFLTCARVPLVLLFFFGAIFYSQHVRTWLFVVTLTSLIASAVTDLFDGYLARKFRVETKFGAHADPLMDKFFQLTTLPVLVFVATNNGRISHAVFLLVLTMLFLARDQWVTFLRSIGAMHNAPGGATWIGKLRTCVNLPLVCVIYYFEEAPLQFINDKFLYTFEAVALVINVISIFTYTDHYWPYLRKSVSMRTEV